MGWVEPPLPKPRGPTRNPHLGEAVDLFTMVLGVYRPSVHLCSQTRCVPASSPLPSPHTGKGHPSRGSIPLKHCPTPLSAGQKPASGGEPGEAFSCGGGKPGGSARTGNLFGALGEEPKSPFSDPCPPPRSNDCQRVSLGWRLIHNLCRLASNRHRLLANRHQLQAPKKRPWPEAPQPDIAWGFLVSAPPSLSLPETKPGVPSPPHSSLVCQRGARIIQHRTTFTQTWSVSGLQEQVQRSGPAF